MSRAFTHSSLLAVICLVLAACGQPPQPMTQVTVPPSGVIIKNVKANPGSVNSELKQVKTFDQCGASSPFKTKVYFTEQSATGTSESTTLIIKGSLGTPVSAPVQAAVEGELSHQFGTTNSSGNEHGEGVDIEVPAHTLQQYTLIWNDIRREGEVAYEENGVSDSATFSYRIGLELVSHKGQDLPCESQTPPLLTATQGSAPRAFELPAGYTIYDDFTNPANFAQNWRLDDPNGICAIKNVDRMMTFNCVNAAAQGNLQAGLHVSEDHEKVSGVAAWVQIDASTDPYQFKTSWTTPDGKGRDYHFELVTGKINIIEYNPNQGWSAQLLATYDTDTQIPHLLQMESQSGTMQFWIDGSPVKLATQPDFGPEYHINYWGMVFLVWPNNNHISGQVYQVSYKP